MAEGSVKRIDTSAFDDAIKGIDQVVSAFASTKDSIDKETKALLSSWKGQGRKSFKESYDILKTQLLDEEENLTTIRDDLTAIKQSYVDWDIAMKDSMVDK